MVCYCFLLLSYRINAAANEKRNIWSVKNSQRNSRMKRDASYDDFSDDSDIGADLYQNNPLNYNDNISPANELYPNYGFPEITYEKRYLGEFFRFQCLSHFFVALYTYKCNNTTYLRIRINLILFFVKIGVYEIPNCALK